MISNRDTKSLRVLDLWLHYIDTQDVLPLFEESVTEYNVPKLKNVCLDDYSPQIVHIIRNRDMSKMRLLTSVEDIEETLQVLGKCNERRLLHEAYVQLLNRSPTDAASTCQFDIACCLLRFLPKAPYATDLLFMSPTWTSQKHDLASELDCVSGEILKQLTLSANLMPEFVRRPLQLVLQEIRLWSVQTLARLIELISLSVRDAETALDLLLEVIEPETSRLLVGHPKAIKQCVKGLIGVALDHIDEAAQSKKSIGEPLRLVADGESDGFAAVHTMIRVDSPLNGLLKKDDHVRLTVMDPPQNSPLERLVTVDAIVLKAEAGEARFRCIHHPPSYFQECAWTLCHCGSFVTSKAMLDALTSFYTDKTQICRLFGALVGFEDVSQSQTGCYNLSFSAHSTLNASQNRALEAALENPLTFLWGPPGTGKTHTIVVILAQLLNALPNRRVLVAAPTHNAVDNILQKFISEGGIKITGVNPLRVSTSVRSFLPLFSFSNWLLKRSLFADYKQVSKVATGLRSYTCDAMVGKDLTANNAARREAQRRVRESRLVFTTCAGAGLGLLRAEKFEIVLVDEASQQTEPETLIPLVKGCQRGVFVGDHVQLRATIQKTAAVVDLDVSLFERHYNMPERRGVAKVMLDTQYRMHADICSFSSSEFYEGKLQTAVPDQARPLPPSQFPWPTNARKVFIPCPATEDIGHQSKSNTGQASVCRKICELLCTPTKLNTAPESEGANTPQQIAVLTPYTRQKELLKSMLPQFEVSSIDGYQGREADIVIFVTVRCNVYYELGFLTDMRRLNVAMTRARTAVIVIGDRTTLTGTSPGNDPDESKKCWTRLLQQCMELDIDNLASEGEGAAAAGDVEKPPMADQGKAEGCDASKGRGGRKARKRK